MIWEKKKKRLVVLGKTQIWQTGTLNFSYPRAMIQGGEWIILRTFFLFFFFLDALGIPRSGKSLGGALGNGRQEC